MCTDPNIATLSRSAFMDRFADLIGMPPIRYITALRLQSAKLQLRETGKTIAQLAHAIGYGSEEAFSRAFKREFGTSPLRWREGASRRRRLARPDGARTPELLAHCALEEWHSDPVTCTRDHCSRL